MSDSSDQDALFPLPSTGEMVSKSARAMVEAALGQDEPVFILRAKDFFSLDTITYYLDQIERYGPENDAYREDLIKIHQAFTHWRNNHISEVRYPD